MLAIGDVEDRGIESSAAAELSEEEDEVESVGAA